MNKFDKEFLECLLKELYPDKVYTITPFYLSNKEISFKKNVIYYGQRVDEEINIKYSYRNSPQIYMARGIKLLFENIHFTDLDKVSYFNGYEVTFTTDIS
jgi:hypothetical protein